MKAVHQGRCRQQSVSGRGDCDFAVADGTEAELKLAWLPLGRI